MGIRFGVQEHSIPTLLKISTTEVQLNSEPVTMAAAGLQGDWQLNHTTDLEIFMRYQYPVASSSSFKAHPGLSFDGSVGIATMFTANWSAGGFWYGQMQSYSFDQTSGGVTTSGKQQVFFSSLQGRSGYFW